MGAAGWRCGTTALFYFLLIVIPLTGLIAVSGRAKGPTTSLVGGLQLPVIPGNFGGWRRTVGRPPQAGWSARRSRLVVLHVGAALTHQFFDAVGASPGGCRRSARRAARSRSSAEWRARRWRALAELPKPILRNSQFLLRCNYVELVVTPGARGTAVGHRRGHRRRQAGRSRRQGRADLAARRSPRTSRRRSGTVAKATARGAPAVSRSVDALVRAGLVEREADPANRRRLALRLSEAGREKMVAPSRSNAALAGRASSGWRTASSARSTARSKSSNGCRASLPLRRRVSQPFLAAALGCARGPSRLLAAARPAC